MKSLCCSLLFLLAFDTLAQDTLYLTSGAKEAVVLLEVNPDNLRYKRYNNQSGPTYTILKSDVSQVKYKNGKSDVFSKPAEIVKESPKEKEAAKTETPKDSSLTKQNQEDDPFFGGDKADTLFFRSGKRTEAKVLIVSTSEVRYKLFSYQDGPTYNASKYELRSIHYGRGKIENFDGAQNSPSDPPANNTSQNTNPGSPGGNPAVNPPVTSGPGPVYSGGNTGLYQRGRKDADFYYKSTGNAIGAGCGGLACGPVCGLIPTAIIVSSKPKDHNLNMPPNAYSNDPEYVRGYKERASEIKQRKTWTGYGIGALIGAILALALYIYQ